MERRSAAEGRRDGSFVAAVAATVFGNLYLVLGTLLLSAVAIVVGLFDRSGNGVFRVGRLWSRGVLATHGVALEVEIDPAVSTERPVVYMANHQSLLDIPALLASLPGQARMLAKRSLFHIPLFGWAIWLGGFIAIDRKNRSRAKQSFDSAVERLRSGTSALVFPEGTRSTDGALLPFQRGGMLLALKSGLPIVPVGLEGTGEARPKRGWVVRPGRVRVRYGAPIDVSEAGVSQRAALTEQVRSTVARLANTGVAQ